MPSQVAAKKKDRKMTVAEAADKWEHAKTQIEEAKPVLEQATAVLLEHFEKTGRTTYKGRIGLTRPPARTVLDQARVREFLGKRLPEFQRVSEPKPGLTRLEK